MKNRVNNPEVKKLKETINGEIRYYLPLEADLEWVSKFGYNREDFVHVMLGMRRIRCIRIPATKQQYDEFMRPYLAEAQADWRSQKCMVPSEKTGKPVRCKKSCKKCTRMKSGAKLSLDRFIDEGEFEKSEKTVDEEASTLTSLLFSELLGKLEEQAPELADIFGRMFDGASQRELERELGIAHGTMTDRVAAMRKILQRYVSREDIVG